MKWPFSRTDYAKDAPTMTREALLQRLIGEVPMSPLFGFNQLLALFGDRDYLRLRHDLAVKFCAKARGAGYPDYNPEVNDCDDLEAQFRRDRIEYRRKVGLRLPEAMGGIVYTRTDGVQHRAAWVLTDRGLWIFQPQSGRMVPAAAEVKEALYFDA